MSRADANAEGRREWAIRRGSVAALLCIVALGTACANNSSSKVRIPPEKKAVRASQQGVKHGVETAAERSEEDGPFALPVRFNPPRCDAPVFEVQARGTWVRAYIDGNRRVRREIESFRTSSAQESRLSTVWLEGEFRGKRTAETGLTYPVFWVLTFEVEPERAP